MSHNPWTVLLPPGGRFKNAYELLNLRALKILMLYKNRIFQCMSKIFCVEFQRVPLKFHTKYLAHTLKDVNFSHRWNFWNTPQATTVWQSNRKRICFNVVPICVILIQWNNFKAFSIITNELYYWHVTIKIIPRGISPHRQNACPNKERIAI